MGLEIQGAVNSMMANIGSVVGTVGNIFQKNKADKAAAAKIAKQEAYQQAEMAKNVAQTNLYKEATKSLQFKNQQAKLSAKDAAELARQHMQNSQEEKRMKIYGARGEVLNG